MATDFGMKNAGERLREGLLFAEPRKVEDMTRLQALRDAAMFGVHDIEAGRFCSFKSAKALDQHLVALTEGVLGVA